MERDKMRGGTVKGLLPSSLDMLVCALCADFSRREELIRAKSLSARTEAELRYLNYMISEATAEIADARYINTYILEIGKRTGYAHTEITALSEITYKMQKSEIKGGIAKKLHLCD